MSAAEAVSAGLSFLEAARSADGFWVDFSTRAGAATSWPTAYVLERLGSLPSGYLSAFPNTQLAARWLAQNQRSDGGWGYNAQVPADADTTALALLALLTSDGEASPGALSSAVRKLQSHQSRRSGGVATYHAPGPIRHFIDGPINASMAGWCQPHLSVTAVAGRALLAGGDVEAASRAWGFVAAAQRETGDWTGYWWPRPHYPTFQAVEFGAALLESQATADIEGRLASAVGALLAHLEGEGLWELATTAEQAWCVAASARLKPLVRALGDHSARLDDALAGASQRLVASQDDDGGWPTGPFMRIPRPSQRAPDEEPPQAWATPPFEPSRPAPATAIVIGDDRRCFTTATCLAALAAAASLW